MATKKKRKPRSAAQKRAIRKLVAANRARARARKHPKRAAAKRKPRVSHRRAPPKRTPKRRHAKRAAPAPRKRRRKAPVEQPKKHRSKAVEKALEPLAVLPAAKGMGLRHPRFAPGKKHKIRSIADAYHAVGMKAPHHRGK